MELIEKRKPKKKPIREEEEAAAEKKEEQKQSTDERLNKKLKTQEQEEGEGEGAGGGSVVPTEEEVEEFYAILRRMKAAVKYFDEKGKTPRRREWREALEQADLTVVGAGHDHGNKVVLEEDKVMLINGGFDLNAVAPEAAESGGA